MATKNGSDVSVVLATLTAATLAATAAATEARTALEGRLAELNTERDGIIAQLRELGGSSSKKVRKARGTNARSQNKETLPVVIVRVLSKAKGPLSPTEVCEAVIKAGYKTDSDNYAQMVSQNLTKLKSMKMGVKSPIVINPARGEWQSGSGAERYLKAPEEATEIEAVAE